MVLANDAEKKRVRRSADLALLEYSKKRGVEPELLRHTHPRRSSLPFDSSYRHARDRGAQRRRVELSQGCTGSDIATQPSFHCRAEELEEKAHAYAREGYRVLGLGHREGEGDEDSEFAGLVLLWDPPRREVPEAIRRAQDAGIRVVMVTGDHPATALAIAHEVGIPSSRVLTGLELETMPPDALNEAVRDTNIFARVAPEHKLHLVEALKQRGEIVDDLLVVSRVEGDALVLEPEDVQIRPLLAQVVAGLGESRGRIELEEMAGAPSRLTIDPNRLIQILTNLAHNAVKFSPDEVPVRSGGRRPPTARSCSR